MALVFSGRADRLTPSSATQGLHEIANDLGLTATVNPVDSQMTQLARDADIAAIESGAYLPLFCFGSSWRAHSGGTVGAGC